MTGLQAAAAALPPPQSGGDATDAIARHLRDWDWEAIRAGGKLHLFCYVRDGVIPLAPFDFTE